MNCNHTMLYFTFFFLIFIIYNKLVGKCDNQKNDWKNNNGNNNDVFNRSQISYNNKIKHTYPNHTKYSISKFFWNKI